MARLLRLGLIAAQAPLAVMVLYLDILALAAAQRRRPIAPTVHRSRFAVLVPAHDEELLLPRLLASLRSLDYPRRLFDVHVVADNCRDRTAALAREGGAIVHERTDERLRGKGHALRWLLARVADQEPPYDAYVFVDADSAASANLLSVFNARLAHGDQAIQCYYGVLNQDQSWASMLRYDALVLYNGLRPRGRAALGLSAGLRGNGMCLAASLVRRFGWHAFTLAEDAEFHLQILDAGMRVAFAGEAHVLAEMPTALRQAQSQNIRWERGRLHLARMHGPRLLASAVRHRDPARLDALLELALPPLSVLTALAVGGVAITSLIRARGARRLAWLIAGGQAGYVFGGLFQARAPLRAYAALLLAPPFAAWKTLMYARAALGAKDGRWIRTARRRPGSEPTEHPGGNARRDAPGR